MFFCRRYVNLGAWALQWLEIYGRTTAYVYSEVRMIAALRLNIHVQTIALQVCRLQLATLTLTHAVRANVLCIGYVRPAMHRPSVYTSLLLYVRRTLPRSGVH